MSFSVLRLHRLITAATGFFNQNDKTFIKFRLDVLLKYISLADSIVHITLFHFHTNSKNCIETSIGKNNSIMLFHSKNLIRN